MTRRASLRRRYALTRERNQVQLGKLFRYSGLDSLPLVVGLAAFFSTSALAIVCRMPVVSHDWVATTASVKSWLPPDTSDPSKIALYLSHDSVGNLYVQSNFISRASDGTIADNPTKILEPKSALGSIDKILMNVIYWGELPDNAEVELAAAAKSAQLFIDPSLLGKDGRPPFDVGAADTIRLAKAEDRVLTGVIEKLNVDNPPPPLIERISGCCLNGRPAGRGGAIKRDLQSINFNPSEMNALQLVADSATTARMARSKLLSEAVGRGASGSEGLDWGAKIDKALSNSHGRSLVLLSHIENGNVVIRDAAENKDFEIAIDELHRRATDQGVTLLLLGCDTAKEAAGDHVPLSVAGKYNTLRAAELLDKASAESSNAYEFLSKLSNEGLVLVLQEGAWSRHGVGVSAYVRPARPWQRLRRAFRLWFLGGNNGRPV